MKTDIFLTPEELANRWKVTTNTLSFWRRKNKGPRFIAPGGDGRSPLYPLENILKICPDEICYTPEELAKRWHISIRTLSNWRSEGTGPKYFNPGGVVGGIVRYGFSAILEAEGTVND